jgi:uncharacterized protein
MKRYHFIILFFFKGMFFGGHVFAFAPPDTSTVHKVSKVSDEEKVEMEIHGFSDYSSGSYTVFLKEKGTKAEVLLPIVIGGCEALGLSQELSGETFPRPLTYPLLCNMFDSLGILLKAVIIRELKDNTFFAVIVLEQNGRRWEIDARPSDAMNLAIRKKCKIYSYRRIIDQAGIER